jgi:fatty-acyl-CoA synthase
VGKVFKPQLRWDATRRAFEAALAPVASETGARLGVAVGADGTHGTLATVTIGAAGRDASARAALEARVHAALAPYVTRHAIAWDDAAG